MQVSCSQLTGQGVSLDFPAQKEVKDREVTISHEALRSKCLLYVDTDDQPDILPDVISGIKPTTKPEFTHTDTETHSQTQASMQILTRAHIPHGLADMH